MYGKVKDPEKYGSWTRAIKKFWKWLKCKFRLCKGQESCFCKRDRHWSCCGAGKKTKK